MSAKNFQSQVVYQIYVRSFYDSNGDGIGDLHGIIEKLPYLASLGIGYIWLNPIFPSSNSDNGYDITDYCSIDPTFGTMEDLEELIRLSSQYDIGIILDMVFNHTSTEHPWFKKALSGDPHYKDYYFFQKSTGRPPTNWLSKFGGSAWTETNLENEYYLHLFSEKQADLNWKNPNVRLELYDILKFWIKKGITGFRFDVINLISKPDIFKDDDEGDGRRFYTDGVNVENYLKEMRNVIDEQSPNRQLLLVGELSSTTAEKSIPYSKEENKELSMIFHFQHLKTDYDTADNKWSVSDVDYKKLKELFHEWQLHMVSHNAHDALFWNNHDQPRALTRFVSDNKDLYFQSAALLASTIHFMYGTPYIYMGEEIGMISPEYESISDYRDVETLNYYDILMKDGHSETEVMNIIKKRSRDNGRSPMQWNFGKHAGFTTGTPWIHAAASKGEINVVTEEQKSNGILAFYKHLISLRQKYTLIQNGTYHPFLNDMENIIAYIRENEVQYLLCINNYNNTSIQIEESRFFPYQSLEYTVLASNYFREHIDFNAALNLKPFETLVVLMHK